MIGPVALTLGDPAGIGGEIALKAWAELRETLPFFLIGDPGHLAALGARLGLPVRPIAAPDETAGAMAAGLPVSAGVAEGADSKCASVRMWASFVRSRSIRLRGRSFGGCIWMRVRVRSSMRRWLRRVKRDTSR